MKAPFKHRLRYRFEQFLAKGGSSIFISLTIVFLGSFLLIIAVRGFLLLLFPDMGYNTYIDNFFGHIWAVFLQMTDPGNMNQDNDSRFTTKLTTILAGLSGVVILSMLIAFITTSLEKTLYEFRKGRGPVLEEGHTLILGYNERVVEIIRELIIANESEEKASVVVLAQEDKEKMDDFIIKRIPESKTTKIITSSGEPANLNELKRVSAHSAKSVIVLASCSDSATPDEKLLSDTQCVKTIMALIACQGGKNELPIVSEIFTEEKRDIVALFEDENIIAIDSWDIMGKLFVQTSLTSGLEMVYNEILSFDGSEIYFYEADWNGEKFRELPYHFKDGIPLGILGSDGTLTLRPDKEVTMKDGDEILILAEDDSSIEFSPQKLFKHKEIAFAGKELKPKKKRMLMLGWHNVANIFIRESNDYLLGGSAFDIVMEHPNELIRERIADLDAEYPDLNIRLIETSAMSLENLRSLDPCSYDNVIILSQDAEEQPDEKVDSDTLMILLLLRRINNERADEGKKMHVITQVLNSDNQDLIVQTDVDDFIISNKLITMILAQLSEEPRMKLLYDDIFEEDGSEIYVKPAELYINEEDFPLTCSFADLLYLANERDEICLGVRYGAQSKNAKENFGVILNLPKDEQVTIGPDDFLVVLAEDEL
jgi:hypothetical protein